MKVSNDSNSTGQNNVRQNVANYGKEIMISYCTQERKMYGIIVKVNQAAGLGPLYPKCPPYGLPLPCCPLFLPW